MPYDGYGVFNRLFNWQNDAANGINIMADRMDAEFDGVAEALSNAVTRDGQSVMQADLDMGNFKIIRVGLPENDDDAVTLEFLKSNSSWTIDENDQTIFNKMVIFEANARLTGNAPYLSWIESDQVDPIGRWRIIANGGNLQFNHANDAGGFSGERHILMFREDLGNIQAYQSFRVTMALPKVMFDDTNQTDPAGRYMLRSTSNHFQILKATEANFGATEIVAEVIQATPKRFEIAENYLFSVIESGKFNDGTVVVGEATSTPFRIKMAVDTTGVGVICRVDNANFFILMTNNNDANGTFNDLRPFALNKTTGRMSSFNGQRFEGGTLIADGGLSFGEFAMADAQDMSKHILLHPNGYGFAVTGGQLNYNTNVGGLHTFFDGDTMRAQIGTDDLGSAARFYGHVGIPATGCIYWGNSSTDARFQRLSGGQYSFYSGNNTAARVELPGASPGQNYSIITRAMGDARYTIASSLRFKEEVVGADESLLSSIFDRLNLSRWKWGGQMPDEDERHGNTGVGLVVEELEKEFPEAVRHQWVEEAGGEKQPLSLNVDALIAVLVAKIRQLENRLETSRS